MRVRVKRPKGHRRWKDRNSKATVVGFPTNSKNEFIRENHVYIQLDDSKATMLKDVEKLEPLVD